MGRVSELGLPALGRQHLDSPQGGRAETEMAPAGPSGPADFRKGLLRLETVPNPFFIKEEPWGQREKVARAWAQGCGCGPSTLPTARVHISGVTDWGIHGV